MNKLSARDGALAVSPYAGIVSPAYWVLEPDRSVVEPRFLHYLLRSKPYLMEMGRRSKYMPPAQFDLAWDQFRTIPLTLPSLDIQRRLAHFLDEQVALLDRALLLRQQQATLLSQWMDAQYLKTLQEVSAIKPAGLDRPEEEHGWLRLSQLLDQLTNGYVGPTRDLLVDEGVPYLQSLHIKRGGIDFDRRPYYVPQEWVAQRPRIRLRIDDLLIVQTGALGESALVGEEFVGASCHALLIARVDRSLVVPRFLWHTLQSDWGREILLRERTGALHPHLEAGKIRDVHLPAPSLPDQQVIVDILDKVRLEADQARQMVERHIPLIEERKQALITAAVSGQFDVTAARAVA
ncbi:restriction endonuclease subunit S [Geodermatophilus sp. SYSU D00698]